MGQLRFAPAISHLGLLWASTGDGIYTYVAVFNTTERDLRASITYYTLDYTPDSGGSVTSSHKGNFKLSGHEMKKGFITIDPSSLPDSTLPVPDLTGASKWRGSGATLTWEGEASDVGVFAYIVVPSTVSGFIASGPRVLVNI